MNKQSARNSPPAKASPLNRKHESAKSSPDNFQTREEVLPPILPRSAWNSQLSYMRVILKAKLALDRIEEEARTETNKPNPLLVRVPEVAPERAERLV